MCVLHTFGFLSKARTQLVTEIVVNTSTMGALDTPYSTRTVQLMSEYLNTQHGWQKAKTFQYGVHCPLPVV